MNILLRTYCLLDAAAIKALNELLRYQQTIRMHLAALLKAIEQGSESIIHLKNELKLHDTNMSTLTKRNFPVTYGLIYFLLTRIPIISLPKSHSLI